MEKFKGEISSNVETKSEGEYSNRPIYVLQSLDGVNESERQNYKELELSGKVVYVRDDILKAGKEEAVRMDALDKRLGALAPGASLVSTVRKILRPVMRKTHGKKDESERAKIEKKNQVYLEGFLKRKESEDVWRMGVVAFIKQFPPLIQKELKEGAFLIDEEVRDYGDKNVTAFSEYESQKQGTWRRGLLETLVRGIPYVASSIPSNITGSLRQYRAELKNDNVDAVVAGSSFNSGLGGSGLGISVKFKEGGEEKDFYKSFKPF